jgi:di/tricarboxylate transporter
MTESLAAARRRSAHLATLLTLTVLSLMGWIRGDQPADDRGSDSSEKAFMVILAITIGTAVTAAAVAFVATKTALFK